jgi:hypothetical protein
MKYSQRIGMIACLALMGICFLPWSYIISKQLTITGFSAAGTDFGKPGLFNFASCIVLLILFALPAIWAKRTNVFVAALNLAWAFRNYLLISTCMMGECPEKKPALYLLILFAVIIQLMTFLPKMEIRVSRKQD